MTTLSRSRVSTLALLMLALALGALLFTALTPGGENAARLGATADSAEAAAAKTVVINVADYEYSKKTVTIKKGQSVKWVNKDEMKHDATTSKAGGPKGPLLAKGKSYTWKATKTGTFKYHCSPHPFMKATVIVK
ncbi:MAG: plastocyanin/azurin family copper-binding protein [Solirubrobacteraceae bacterium]|nr:plastocyanin/azurin family copper-binding protein [Solirubrobacteraceae bacterium]